jgi:hypothetical protein
MSYPPDHTNEPSPSRDGVVAASTASDAHGSRHPYPCAEVYRDALKDLVSHDGMTSIKPNEKKCPYGIALERNGLVKWTQTSGPGKWVITARGFAFLETRTFTPEETR